MEEKILQTKKNGMAVLLPIDPDASAARIRRALERHGPEDLYIDQGHVRPLGNELVAEAIAEALGPWYEARTGGRPNEEIP